MQLFSADATMFLQCFAHKKLKKPPSKVAHNRPKPFIPQPSPAQPTANSPKSIFHIIKMSHQASVLLSVVTVCPHEKNVLDNCSFLEKLLNAADPNTKQGIKSKRFTFADKLAFLVRYF
jgi:hypothetical protein